MLQSRLIRRRHEPQRLIASDCNHKLKRLFSKRQFTYAIKKKTVTFVATQGVELQQVYLCELQAAGLEASPPIMLELLFVCNSTLPAFPIWDQSNREREREFQGHGSGRGCEFHATTHRSFACHFGAYGKRERGHISWAQQEKPKYAHRGRNGHLRRFRNTLRNTRTRREALTQSSSVLAVLLTQAIHNLPRGH